MSLDVYLTIPGAVFPVGADRIYIREDGATREISRAEWEARYPGREPVTVAGEGTTETAYNANITHNLGGMAQAAGLYEALWRPDEHGYTHARDLIPLLQAGLAALEANPERFTPHAPANGWGTYQGLVDFTTNYLWACETYPEALVKVSR